MARGEVDGRMESLSASRRLAIYFHRRPVWQKCTLPTYYLPQLRRYEREGDYILHKEPKVDERMMYIYSVGLSARSARVPPATNTASFTQPVEKFIQIVLRIQRGVSTMEGSPSEQRGQRSTVRPSVKAAAQVGGVHCERGVDGL